MRHYKEVNKHYTLEDYETDKGKIPFQEWIARLKDRKALMKIAVRLERAETGNFGDAKSLKGTDGICEMRLTHGPGYRIYYRLVGETVVLLLIGSTKADQDRQIAKAKDYYEDYKRRNHDV